MRHVVPMVALWLGACRHDNPTTTREVVWADATTEALARRACYDCHSNETHWPWYSWMPIAGSLVTSDVHRGRCELNFSEWDRFYDDASEAPEKVREKEMPLGMYLAAHRDARLTDAERETLAKGLAETFRTDPPVGPRACDD